jgi:hypothetical protein
VDGALGMVLDRTGFIDRLADHVHDAAQGASTHRHHDRRAGVGHRLTANQTFGGVHGDGAYGAFAQVLRHFQNQAVAAIVGFQRVQDRRQVTIELHVNDGADDLGDLAGLATTGGCLLAGADVFDAAFLAGAFLAGALAIFRVLPLSLDYQSASAPEMISISSLVICA